MSSRQIAGAPTFRLGGRRLSPAVAYHGGLPMRRRRGRVDWRVVALTALSAILLVAMMARP